MTLSTKSPALGTPAVLPTAEEIARRYARRLPGFHLVNYDQVALPLFRMQVRLLKITRKHLPALQEFTLRAIHVGLCHAADIAGFLGLEAVVVNGVLTELLSQEHIVLQGGDGDRNHRLALTEQGRSALQRLTFERAEEETHTVLLDGLTRRIIYETDLDLWRGAQVNKEGLVEIPPYPRRRPEVEDFRDQMVRDWKERNPEFDLLAVLEVERVDAVFRHDALLLAFRQEEAGDEDRSATQVGFVVGGHWSDMHADAFRQSDASSRLPLLSERYGMDAARDPAELLRPDLAELAAPSEETTTLREQATRAEERIRDVEAQLSVTSSASEKSALQELLRQEQARRAEAEALLASIPVRQLETFDHPPLLDEAFKKAKERMMIISPWIRRAVVNERFKRQLEAVLRRGVAVYIGYGISNGDEGNDRESLALLEDLETRHNNLFLTEIGNTHAKVLVCDRRFVVITSFNWLSFRGDARRGFRDERGYYVGIEGEAEKTFASYLSQFRAATH